MTRKAILKRLAILREKLRLHRALKARKAITKARSDAAKRGVSTEWRKRGQKCRETFG